MYDQAQKLAPGHYQAKDRDKYKEKYSYQTHMSWFLGGKGAISIIIIIIIIFVIIIIIIIIIIINSQNVCHRIRHDDCCGNLGVFALKQEDTYIVKIGDYHLPVCQTTDMCIPSPPPPPLLGQEVQIIDPQPACISVSNPEKI